VLGGDGGDDFGVHVMRWVGVYRVSCDDPTMPQSTFLAILFCQITAFLRDSLGQPPKMRMISR
jgi:hypothetical protein